MYGYQDDLKVLGDCASQITKNPVYDPFENFESKAAVASINNAGIRDAVHDIVMDKKLEYIMPMMAEAYKISANIKDYVMVPVVIMASDIPNRNMQGFPAEELLKFNIDSGRLGFQTWKHQPTHVNHVNDDPLQAKGFVVDSVLRKLNGYKGNLLKVVSLLAFDRTKDVKLVDDILNKRRTAYSMGALSKRWTCSICGRERHENCGHITPGPAKMYNGVIAFWQIRDIKGFEVSNVGAAGSGAYDSAENPHHMTYTGR